MVDWGVLAHAEWRCFRVAARSVRHPSSQGISSGNEPTPLESTIPKYQICNWIDMTGDGSVPFTRRQLLLRLGAGGLATVAGGAALGSPPSSPDGEGDHGPVRADPDTVDEDDTPYAVWHYRRDGNSFSSTAPINVVFPLEHASFADLVAVFEDAGWYPYGEEYARYAWNRETAEYQLQDWTATETYYGKVGRHHVRCWETAGTASIQAHVDTAALPDHGISSYAAGQRGVESLFETAGWSVEQDALDFGNDRSPDHDGQVSVIRWEGD